MSNESSPFAPDSAPDEFTPAAQNPALPLWAQIRANVSVEDATDTSEQPPVPRRSPKKHRAGLRLGKKTSTADKGTQRKPSKTKKAFRAGAGGRWMVLALRVLVYTLVVVLLGLGVARIANPVPISTSEVADEVQSRLGIVDFPIATGEHLATTYVQAYFTYDASAPNPVLVSLLPSPSTSGAFRPQPQGDVESIRVLAGPTLEQAPEILSESFATFTYTVLTSTTIAEPVPAGSSEPAPTREVMAMWTVAVPIAATSDGLVSLAGPLSVVPASPLATDAPRVQFDVDKDASTDAADYLRLYFEQWGTATPADPVSDAYLVPASSYAARTGLGGEVALQDVSSVLVRALPETASTTGSAIQGQLRDAIVQVRWRTPDDALVMTATYRLDLLFRDDYWYVLDIRGGTFADN